jgi:hypothetical protein
LAIANPVAFGTGRKLPYRSILATDEPLRLGRFGRVEVCR